MKKLILITTIILLNALLIINTQCNALNTPDQNFLQTLVAQFAAFKNYLFQPTSTFLKNRYQLQQQKPLLPLFTTTQTLPFIQYDPVYQRAILYTNKNITKDFEKIDNYYFSPTKKYLIIKTSSPGAMLRLTGQKQFFGYNQTITLIETSSGRTIKQFEGNVVMFEFSPNEETLLIATAYNPTGTLGNIRNIHQAPSKEHQSSTKQRQQTESGEILFYEIFDIPTELITTKLENVQATQFTAYNDLFIKYDDNIIDKINLSNKQQSINNQFKQVINYFTRGYLLDEVDYSPKYEKITHGTEFNTFIKANYHYYDKSLTVTLPYQAAHPFKYVNFYSFSPQRNYIIINKKPESWEETFKSAGTMLGAIEPSNNTETIIYSTQLNPTELSLMNAITYEFSPDEKKIITLNESSTEKNHTYKLFNLHDNKPIKEFTDIKSLYFTPNGELIAINQDGERVSCDTTTGETVEEKQNRLEQEELKRQEQEKRKQEEERKKIEQQEQEKIAQEKRELEEIEKKKKYEEDEKIKQEAFSKLSEPEKRLAPIEVLPEKQRLQKEYGQTILGTAGSAVVAVGSRGFPAIAQQAKDIASETASSIKEYLFPSTQTSTETPEVAAKPEITPSDDSEDEFEEPESELEGLMNKLQAIIDNKEKRDYHEQNAAISNQMVKIVKELNEFQDIFEYQEFISLYNEFTPEQKQTFNQYFFSGNNIERSITNKTGNTIQFNIDDKNIMGIAIVNKEIPAAGAAK